MNSINNLYCHAPCSKCPFRKDILKGWLGEARMREIVNAEGFVCHQDTSKQCAGFLIINEKDPENSTSSFLRLANRLHMNISLKNKDIIFDTKVEVINHHKN